MTPSASGIAFGLAASLAWAIYNVSVEVGRGQGLASADLTMLRYLGGACVMAPLLLIWRQNPFRGTTPGRLLVLMVVAGPPFAWAINTGYALAPLSHAVVISPGMTMVTASLLSRVVGGAPVPTQRKIGMALLVAGLVVIGSDQSSAKSPDIGAWAGDLCFVCSGTLWGIFTWLMSHWRLDPVRTTGLIAIASSALYLPIYAIAFDLPEVPFATWAQQVVYQGALGGALAIVFFVAAIARLGPSMAGVFPALVPPMAVLTAVPMTGQWPNALQMAGIAMATAGLLVSVDLVGGLIRRRFRSQDHSIASR